MSIPTILQIHFQLIIAGMPSATYTLSNMFRLRLQTISFFFLIVLLSAWVIQKFWNSLQKEYPKLLRLSFKAALFGTILWGLLFVFVLTMISGARELMTPGAWKQVGQTYYLRDKYQQEEDKKSDVKDSEKMLEDRLQSMNSLRTVLWADAATQKGKFPDNTNSGKFSQKFWVQPGGMQIKYKIVAEKHLTTAHSPLVYEQAIYGDDKQFVLFTDGVVELLSIKR